MAIILVILCLVGAMAGSTLPTDSKTSSAQTAVTTPVASTQPTFAVAQNPSCDAHPRYRDLSLPVTAQPTQSSIELCHDP